MYAERLYVCETCVHDAPADPGEGTRGERLARAIQTSLAADPALASRIIFRRASCLNGCLSPCNVALRGPAKYSIRFSRLSPGDDAAVVRFATLYVASRNGDVPLAKWPSSLIGKDTARTPPPPFQIRES